MEHHALDTVAMALSGGISARARFRSWVIGRFNRWRGVVPRDRKSVV